MYPEFELNRTESLDVGTPLGDQFVTVVHGPPDALIHVLV
jgi:hypothetical protein